MLEIIAIIAVILAIAIAVILILAANKPVTFRVQRAASIKAPAERIFPLINDFHQWGGWSPWEGDKNVGTGRMEILEAAAPSKIVIKLDFIKPFEAHNTAEFTMLPQGDATNLTWQMHGPTPFMHRVMQLFMDFDKLVGKDFEAGLANLKKLTEK
jgi:hypothetical protein